jgi:hypothetical protein
MTIGYEHSTNSGAFHILLSAGRWTLFCDEEKIGDYATAIQALNSLLVGHRLRNGNTSQMGVPAHLSDWTSIRKTPAIERQRQ